MNTHAPMPRSTRTAMIFGGVTFASSQLLSTLGMVAALGVSAQLYRDGAITLGTVFVVFQYTQILIQPVEEISRQLRDFQLASASHHPHPPAPAGGAHDPRWHRARRFRPARWRSISITSPSATCRSEPTLRNLTLHLAPARRARRGGPHGQREIHHDPPACTVLRSRPGRGPDRWGRPARPVDCRPPSARCAGHPGDPALPGHGARQPDLFRLHRSPTSGSSTPSTSSGSGSGSGDSTRGWTPCSQPGRWHLGRRGPAARVHPRLPARSRRRDPRRSVVPARPRHRGPPGTRDRHPACRPDRDRHRPPAGHDRARRRGAGDGHGEIVEHGDAARRSLPILDSRFAGCCAPGTISWRTTEATRMKPWQIIRSLAGVQPLALPRHRVRRVLQHVRADAGARPDPAPLLRSTSPTAPSAGAQQLDLSRPAGGGRHGPVRDH